MSSTSSKIAIVGGGPGGLTLARILQQNGIDCTIFEKESSENARSQGGTLDVREESGQKAIIGAGLMDQIKPLLRYEGTEMRIYDSNGELLIHEKESEDASNPEVDRTELRRILLSSLKEGTVKWNSHVKRLEEHNNKYNIHFEDGTNSSEYDLIVGADGAWSKVRPLLSSSKPEYSGVSMVEILHTNVPSHVRETVGKGSMIVLKSGIGLISQKNGDGSVKHYLSFYKPEDWLKTSGIDFTNTKQSRDFLLSLYENWSEIFKKMMLDCDDLFIPRPLYHLPIGHKWEHKTGLTLVGDSAHLMTPFAGEGVNAAMLDALELAESIIKHPHDLDKAVREYESSMFPRAEDVADGTKSNLNRMFLSENGSKSMVEFFESMGPPPEN